MNFRTSLKPGVVVRILMPRHVRDRLRLTCFRGKHLKMAGNFHRWENAVALFRDRQVLYEFRKHLREIWDEKDFGKLSCTIDYPEMVGWNSTAPTNLFRQEDLEEFKPNRKSRALRVKIGRDDILAPQTNKLTIVFQIQLEGSEPLVSIFSIYPGVDVGELKGNVTEREQRVFFDFGHPGA